MASNRLLFLSFLIAVFAISAAARPCKTIFFITSSSSSSDHHEHINSPRNTYVVTEIRQFHRATSFTHRSVDSSITVTSVRDRVMDIMSIVGALLFGLACGALTSATMYLIWYLFSSGRVDSDDDEEYHEGEAQIIRNKLDYAPISAIRKPVPSPAEEIDAMN